jgi:hypothetical protein
MFLLPGAAEASAHLSTIMPTPLVIDGTGFGFLTPESAATRLQNSSQLTDYLQVPFQTTKPDNGKVDFDIRNGSQFPHNNLPEYILQRGKFSQNGLSLLAEIGDITITETQNTAQSVSRRGGRFVLQMGNSSNAIRLQAIAASGAWERSSESLMSGMSGELSLLTESIRFKTIYLKNREPLISGAVNKGDVIGFLVVLEPFKRKLVVETEADLARFDSGATDNALPVQDWAYRIKTGGALGVVRYTALHERTGPDYRLLAGTGPRRDTEGITLDIEHNFQFHILDLKFARYHDNVNGNATYPRLYSYEGTIDYTFKGIRALLLGLQYRKTLIDSTREPRGYTAKETDEDAISGRINYLVKKWDLGLKMGYSQRTNVFKNTPELSVGSVVVSPKFTEDNITVMPVFSVSRSKHLTSNIQKNVYAINIDVKGNIIDKKLNYEASNWFSKERISVSRDKEAAGIKLKFVYKFDRVFNNFFHTTIGARGEYRRTSDQALSLIKNDYNLMLYIDSGKGLF